jgi:transcriptional regulator with XRE-family HTH domain
METEMKDRLIKFLAHENLSATKFADEIGVQRSSISHIISGRNNPSYEFIYKILSRYKYLNAEWLIIGNGQMLKKSDNIPSNQFSKPVIQQLDLFQNIPERPASAENSVNPQVKNEPEKINTRKIDKILLFYSDKTFEEFSPG